MCFANDFLYRVRERKSVVAKTNLYFDILYTSVVVAIVFSMEVLTAITSISLVQYDISEPVM